MATRYTYDTNLSDDAETEVRVSFTVAWGSPGTGRPYYGPPELYDEGSPDEVEDLRLELVNGAARPTPFGDFGALAVNQEFEAAILQEIAQNHTEAMLEVSRDREEYWADDAADSRREAGW